MGFQPLIGLTCCRKDIQGQAGQAVHEKYINAIVAAGGIPVLLPHVLTDCADHARLLDALDGILLTGSYSNVAPARYQATHDEPATDLGRDALSFMLLDHAVEHDKPLLALCRGHQEVNVYFGGTLLRDYRDHPQFDLPHLEDSSLPLEVQYGDAHLIEIEAFGLLEDFGEMTAEVNSLHKQGVDKIAPGMRVEAFAPDGMIEAISWPAHRFLLGVQWHPEFRSTEKPLSRYIFSRFIEAASQR